ncbi:hypothetical protein ACIBP6_09705 [Nonomuraea terrae]|uniref:hypothetical protein n=1 Tax=Nonomuraea terrae TaxID=2530383 RepID=UPI0037B503CA
MGLSPFTRRTIFLRAADLLRARAEEVIALMAVEVGGTRPWAGFSVAPAAEMPGPARRSR